MQVQHVDAVDAEPGEAAFDAPQHPVATEVGDGIATARGSAHGSARLVDQDAADLGRDHVVVAGHASQRQSELALALARAVQRGGVEEAHVAGERRAHRGDGIRITHRGEEVADRGAAEPRVVPERDERVQRTELCAERHVSYSSRLSGVSG
ncbi:hypothetical protein D3C73_1333080 [compost metagenome]